MTMMSCAHVLYLCVVPFATTHGFTTTLPASSSSRRRTPNQGFANRPAPSSRRARASSTVVLRHSHDVWNVDEILQHQVDVGAFMEETDTWSRPSTTSYDPADAFAGQSSYADLMMEELEVMEHQHPTLGFRSSVIEEDKATEAKEKTDISSVDDIIRDLNGLPLTNYYLAKAMGVDRVDGYTCPQQDAFRGFMSNACRVHLQPGGETAFYKRILFSQLPHAKEKQRTAPHKLVRDAKSYQVVARFLQSRACQKVQTATGVVIPKLYDAQMKPDFVHPMESKFSFLMQDLSPVDGWYQTWLLDDAELCETTLSVFAKIHAFFWQGSDFWKDVDAAKELEAAIWKSGSYVQPKAQNVGQCEKVASEWATKRMRFEKDLSGFDFWDNLGERLESVVEECGRLAHPFAHQDDDPQFVEKYWQYRTFTHGDPKQANLLFHLDDASNELQVGLIDFQWSGFGLAATDIAHLITSAIHASQLENGGEARLLRHYYNELQKHLVQFGAYPSAKDALKSYSFDTFMEQYEIAVLDICRLMIAYTWDRFEEPVTKENEAACVRTMNKTSYNKSVPTIVWLLSRCDEILKARRV